MTNAYCLRGDSLQRNNTAGSSVGGAECYLENTCADWFKTGQEPYGEWCARIQGTDVGCARHRSAERTLLPNLKRSQHAWLYVHDMKSLLHNVSVNFTGVYGYGKKDIDYIC